MRYLQTEVVTTIATPTVEVTLAGNAANVMIMDTANYRNYQRGRAFRYFGGHYDQSPAVIRPPTPGRWHLVVDLGGAAGALGATFRVVR